MKNIFILVIVGIIGYFAWNSFSYSKRQLEPITQLPYIYIYGIDEDVLTNTLRDQLGFMKVEYVYKNVREEENIKELTRRLEGAGMGRQIKMPMVDVNGYLIKPPKVKQGKDIEKVHAWANKIIEIYNDH